MMKLKVVYKCDTEGNWIATIPEIPGCVSDGLTVEEARKNIREALECCVDVLSEEEAATAELIETWE